MKERLWIAAIPLLGLSLFILTGPWIAQFHVLPGRVRLWSENWGHFRILALAAAAVGASLGTKRRGIFRLGALFALFHAGAILSYSLPVRAPARPAGGDVVTRKLLYANLASPEDSRAANLIPWIRREGPDFLFFTEYTTAHCDTALASLFEEYPHRILPRERGGWGKAFFSRRTFGETGTDSGMMWVALQDPPLTIFLVHLPPPESYDAWLERGRAHDRLAGHLGGSKGPLFVVGDFNATERTAGFRNLRATPLVEARQGHGWSPTWGTWSPRRHAGNVFMTIPLDHALVSPEIRVLRYEVGENFGSDHLPLLVAFEVPRP